MKRSWIHRVAAIMPRNDYKFAPYCVEVFKHGNRIMTPSQTDFISSVQRLPLEAVALLILKHGDNAEKLELIRIAMLFHIYRNDFDLYLKNNKTKPKIGQALEVWKDVKGNGSGVFKA